MLTFYEEPFSHWCVKARKIMDYRKIRYEGDGELGAVSARGRSLALCGG